MRLIRKLYSSQAGVTLVEVLMSIVILSGGLLALATAMAQGMFVMSTSHFHQTAKERASAAMESVFTSRDSNKIGGWDAIRNVSNNGIFLDGAQSMKMAGPDGLSNTADDLTTIESDPGKNGIPGDEDDIQLNNFTREIQIADMGTNLRQITIIITYRVGSLNRQYRLTAYMSPFA
jgi:prepilin-type N-terminal cleavage/methylation domain-containing protein